MPKQHGAWAMLIVPFGLGIAHSGFDWLHIPLAIAWLSLYLATYPFLLALKKKKNAKEYLKWFYRYAGVAVIAVLPVLITHWKIVYVGFLMLPFFLLNMYFSKMNKDRAFLNDMSAILAFSMSVFAVAIVGGGTFDKESLLLWTYSVLFFTGSTFFVKSMIREKKNPAFRWMSWFYHILTFVVVAVIKGMISLAFLPSVVRAIVLYGRKLTPIQIGILEIVNSVWFFFFILLFR